MKKVVMFFMLAVVLIGIIGCSPRKAAEEAGVDFDDLATCLADKNVIMYGSITCSACAATRKMFADSFSKITEVECNPHVDGNQVDLCLEREVRSTPTWIMEKDGQVIKRMDGYQLAEDLVEFFEC